MNETVSDYDYLGVIGMSDQELARLARDRAYDESGGKQDHGTRGFVDELKVERKASASKGRRKEDREATERGWWDSREDAVEGPSDGRYWEDMLLGDWSTAAGVEDVTGTAESDRLLGDFAHRLEAWLNGLEVDSLTSRERVGYDRIQEALSSYKAAVSLEPIFDAADHFVEGDVTSLMKVYNYAEQLEARADREFGIHGRNPRSVGRPQSPVHKIF